jgi:hypothetical protein
LLIPWCVRRCVIKERAAATVFTDSGSPVLLIESISRDKDKLVINGKVLGTMSMDMIFPSEEVFRAIRIALCGGVVSYVFLLPYFGLKNLFKRNA